jgi:hypothetical protein
LLHTLFAFGSEFKWELMPAGPPAEKRHSRQNKVGALAGRAVASTGKEPPLTDLLLTGPAGRSTVALGGCRGGPEADMVPDSPRIEITVKIEEANRKAGAIGGPSGLWAGTFCLAGVLLFMVEWSAGLEYVQARLAALMPNFAGTLPALSLAAWRVLEGTFWNGAHWEATFRTMSFVTMPFVLVVLGLSMRQQWAVTRERSRNR